LTPWVQTLFFCTWPSNCNARSKCAISATTGIYQFSVKTGADRHRLRPVDRVGYKELATPSPATFGGPPSLRNIKYTRTHHSKKIKNFLPRGAPRKCLGAPEKCFPRPRCGSRQACTDLLLMAISIADELSNNTNVDDLKRP